MRSLMILAPLTLALVACSEGRQTYYQTRSTPTSTADAYGPAAKVSWGDNSDQIYELPVPKPDKNAEAAPRKDCQVPGPQFKSQALVAWGDAPVRPVGHDDDQSLVGMKLDRPVGDDIERHRHPVVSNRARLDQPGIDQFPYGASTGATDRRPVSTTGAGTEEHSPYPLVNYNDRTNPYCEHPEGAGVLAIEPMPDKPPLTITDPGNQQK